MTINPQMKGKIISGSVVLFCGHCGGPAIDAGSDTILKICSTCGAPLGEWNTTAQRDAEVTEFVEGVKLHYARARKEKTGRVARGKTESKSKSMSFGGGGRKKKPKYGRKRGHK
jgi:hypothetical protein